jgi:hypothetical protein
MNSNNQDISDALESEIQADSNRGIRLDFSNLSPQRIVAAIIATALLVLFVIWAIAVTADNAAQVQVSTIGYKVLNEKQTEVSYTVKQPAVVNQSAYCEATALNKGFAVVGFKEIEIAKGAKAGDVIKVTLNTSELAVSGLVDACRLK